MKSLSIVTAILLIANINLVYSEEVIDTTTKEGVCPLVCTRPDTSLNADKCICISDKDAQVGTKSLKNDNSMHYIGSKITGNGSEVTIYKDQKGQFIAIYPDKEPPDNYIKGKTLKEILGFEKIDGKEDGADYYGKVDHKVHKKASKEIQNKITNTKMVSGGAPELVKNKDGVDVDHQVHKNASKETPNTKIVSSSVPAPELVKNKDGADKLFATITKRGTGEKINVYKDINGSWITYGSDGKFVRHKNNQSLEDIFKAENHVGPISARDKYQIELDQWNRAEATRKKLKAAEEAARK